jgi:hypothetical protein
MWCAKMCPLGHTYAEIAAGSPSTFLPDLSCSHDPTTIRRRVHMGAQGKRQASFIADLCQLIDQPLIRSNGGVPGVGCQPLIVATAVKS